MTQDQTADIGGIKATWAAGCVMSNEDIDALFAEIDRLRATPLFTLDQVTKALMAEYGESDGHDMAAVVSEQLAALRAEPRDTPPCTGCAGQSGARFDAELRADIAERQLDALRAEPRDTPQSAGICPECRKLEGGHRSYCPAAASGEPATTEEGVE